MAHPAPDIPGREESNPDIVSYLQSHLSQLCGDTNFKPRFPGSQPISFTEEHLELLEQKDFWVCEKSDGLRVLLFMVMNQGNGHQEVWLVDRKQRFYNVTSLPYMGDRSPDTVIDGELITDRDPKTEQETLRFYAFDCLAHEGECVTAKPITKRYVRLQNWAKTIKSGPPGQPTLRDVLPFEVVVKKQALPYHISTVLGPEAPILQHGSDGLIFTCAETPYVFGTDPNILKWKPASENSVDFKLILRFPPRSDNSNTPDFTEKPAFLLCTWTGGNSRDTHRFFDSMDVTDEAWDQMKQSGEQYDERIVEVVWNAGRETWEILRFRDDKQNANHESVLQKILISIQDGVEQEALLSRSDRIRSAWKEREAEAKKRAQAQTQAPQVSHHDRAAAYHAPAVATGGMGGLRR